MTMTSRKRRSSSSSSNCVMMMRLLLLVIVATCSNSRSSSSRSLVSYAEAIPAHATTTAMEAAMDAADDDDDDRASAECPFLAHYFDTSSDDISGNLWDLLFPVENDEDENSMRMRERMRMRDLRRYDHYKSGSGYKYERDRNRRANVYSSLSDIWLCLACAVGWTVWLVSATRNASQVEPSIFESEESRSKIFGNVLQVTLGQDPDGTGIPIYHTLVDYVVESNLEDEEPLQVRKCFSTRKLLEEGFANVEVLVLLEDPTKSILMEDYIQDRKERNKKQLEPPDMIYAIIVYLIAAVLIVTSLVGGLHAYLKLDPEQSMWGKISLGVGTVLIYPVALLLYHSLISFYRWASPLVERPGVIIHGAQRYWKHKCGATLNPLEIMKTFDGPDATASNSDEHGGGGGGAEEQPMPHQPGSNRIKRISPQNRHKRRDTALSAVMEMSHITSSFNEDDDNSISDNKKKTTSQTTTTTKTTKPLYPNAGCGFGNFNVLMPTRRKVDDDDDDAAATNNPHEAALANGAYHASVLVDNNYKAPTESSSYHGLLSAMSMSSMSSAGSTGTGSTRAKSNTGAPPVVVISSMDESSYKLSSNNHSGILGAGGGGGGGSGPTRSRTSSNDLNNSNSNNLSYVPPAPSSMPNARSDSGSSASSSYSHNNNNHKFARMVGALNTPNGAAAAAAAEESTPVASNVQQHTSSSRGRPTGRSSKQKEQQ